MPSPLENFLIAEIQKDGAIDISTLMQHALSHPQYGYYMTRDPFGAAGDFTTAPEISQMFGEILGAWVADVWQKMGVPGRFYLIECGPGRGTLMADMMRAVKTVNGFHRAAQIRLMEMSPVLREAQQKALDAYGVVWCGGLDDIPADAPCIIIGNEFLDALPIHQMMRTKDGWQERVVAYKNSFVFEYRPADTALLTHLPSKTVSETIYEVSPARCGFVADCAKRLETTGGAALFVDYGPMHSGGSDTLQAVKSHNFVAVLEHIGEADLTSHVDFEALQKGLSGVASVPVATQAQFLQRLGIGLRAQKLQHATQIKKQRDEIEEGLVRLTHPHKMGSLFKVLCFYKGLDGQPAGFEG